LRACNSINEKTDNIGTRLLEELCSIGGRERDLGQYEQLLQKLSEILVIKRVVGAPWPEGTIFEHEPVAAPGGPSPEIMVQCPNERFLIEVKTPLN